MRPDQKLTLAAANLARSSPTAWKAFIEALDEMSLKRARELVQAPPESMQTVQGRAQECVSLCTSLRDAVKNADRISSKS